MLNLAIGRRELGKTTLVTSLARKFPQRIFLDPRRMIRSTTARMVSSVEEIGPAVTELYENPDTLHELIIAPAPNVKPDACFVALSQAVAEWIVRDETAPLAVVFDEMRLVERVVDKCEAFDFILRSTPREVVYVYMTCHRPKDVPPNVRAIIDQWLIFRTTQERDLTDIEEIAGRDAVQVIRTLPPYHWFQWDDSHAVARLHQSPDAWYVPLKEVHSDKPTIDPFGGMPTSDPMAKARLFN